MFFVAGEAIAFLHLNGPGLAGTFSLFYDFPSPLETRSRNAMERNNRNIVSTNHINSRYFYLSNFRFYS